MFQHPRITGKLTLCMCLWIVFQFCASSSASTDFFVSANGRDQWSGRIDSPNSDGTDGPFATLQGARDEIRELKASGGLPEGGVTVWIAGGMYSLQQGFELSSQDSGNAKTPIVYATKAGAEVRISGGRIVSGWQKVGDPGMVARLQPDAKDKVVQADLKAQGIADWGQYKSRGFGRSASAALELFFNDRPMNLSRWPNEGFLKISGVPDSFKDEHGGTMGKLEGGFNYDSDRPSQWADTSDIWVHGYWAYDWANSYEHVASIDTTARLIKTSPPYGNYGFRAGGDGGRFFFLNILEELDTPGEWFLDRKTGILYFWPPEAMEQASVVVSIVQGPLIHIKDASHIEFRGLTIECGRADGIRIDGGSDNRIVNSIIRNIGNCGISINGGSNHGVQDCTISETGDGGISLSGGDRKTISPAGHFARNNHIHHVARWSRCYSPAIAMSGVGIVAANNLIHDHPHCAILFSGNEHLIEKNEIHHVCLETGDVGAIYTGRDYTYRGNIIRHNFIHHTGGVGMGSMGIYMDDCVSGTQIYGNILWGLHRAVFLGGGRDFTVQNNIFVNCDPAVELDGRGLSKSPVWHNMVYETMKQRLEEMDYKQPPYSTRYPELAALDAFYAVDDGVPPGNILVANNICVGSALLKITWGASDGMAQLRDNIENIDPGFANPGSGDFRLKSDSLVFEKGFKAIPMETIGRIVKK